MCQGHIAWENPILIWGHNSHAFKYRMPKVSKDVFKFSFFPRSITEWNLLPADLVNCKSLSNFKLNLGKLVNK